LIAKRGAAVLLGLSFALCGCAHMRSLPPGQALTPMERQEAIRRARVWSPIDIPSLDLKAGPDAKGEFAFNEWVTCEYKVKKLSGMSPKFECETSPGKEVKVKYGPNNAEVFGEVLSTRLFWALGFAADRMYPVRVRCHGCSTDPWHSPAITAEVTEFDPAAIKRTLPGRAMETRTDSGWKWSELEDIGPDALPGARAQRDALKLLAAFVQHTDSKAANQRLLCPKEAEVGTTGCLSTILMVSDLGCTFGHAGLLLRLNPNSVRLAAWRQVPVWKDRTRCVAHLSRSFLGSISNPKISEAGRAFLAGLLVQLSDAQLRDLFEAARVNRRPSDRHKDGPLASVDEWVTAFKLKRAQIVDQRCPQ
jgi:hypothetical protein